MSIESTKEFLKKIRKDRTLRGKLAQKGPEEAAAVAAESGFDVTAEELSQAEQELKKAFHDLGLRKAQKCGLPVTGSPFFL